MVERFSPFADPHRPLLGRLVNGQVNARLCLFLPPVPPVLLVDSNSCFIVDCLRRQESIEEISTRRKGGAGGEITIGQEQSASPSHLAVVGLEYSFERWVRRLGGPTCTVGGISQVGQTFPGKRAQAVRETRSWAFAIPQFTGLPEFDWFGQWAWCESSESWMVTTDRPTPHELVFRVAVPSRTRRHPQAAIPRARNANGRRSS